MSNIDNNFIGNFIITNGFFLSKSQEMIILLSETDTDKYLQEKLACFLDDFEKI